MDRGREIDNAQNTNTPMQCTLTNTEMEEKPQSRHQIHQEEKAISPLGGVDRKNRSLGKKEERSDLIRTMIT